MKQWKNITNQKLLQTANDSYNKIAKEMSKTVNLSRTKSKIKKEQYLTKLKRSEASIIFKLRCRMINLKNNFKATNKDQKCPRCKKDTDNEQHLFGKCEKLLLLYEKHKIQNYDEIFEETISMDRLKQIATFIKDVKL